MSQKKSKLSESEQKILTSITSNFFKQHQRLDEYQAKLEDLERQRNQILDSVKMTESDIIEIRKSEMLFIQDLKSKYGEFKMDITTFEIEFEDGV